VSVTLYPVWIHKYGIGKESTFGTGVDPGDNFPASGNDAKELLLTNRPSFTEGINVIDTRQARGVPYRHSGEFQQGTKAFGTTIELRAHADNMALLVMSLFQNVTEGGTAHHKQCVPYTSSTSMDFSNNEGFFFSLCDYTGVASNSFRLVSCIARSITFSGDAGGNLMASVEVIAKDLETNYNSFGSAGASSTSPLLVQDMMDSGGHSIAASDGTGESDVEIESFSVTFSNNAVPRYGENQTPYNYILGDFTVEGRITIPWEGSNTEIDNYLNGTIRRLRLGWGTAPFTQASAVAGDFGIQVRMRYTGATLAGDEDQQLELSFIGVADSNGSAGEVHVTDGADWI